MATYGGQNYGAGKPERVWQGVKVSSAMMFAYALVVAAILLLFSRQLALLFVDPHETEILDKAALYLHVSCFFSRSWVCFVSCAIRSRVLVSVISPCFQA